MVRLCFDYGHGGRDLGAMYKDRRESMDNLAIGSEIAKRVRIFGIEVDEIRTVDIDVSLRQRVDFANKGNYDYFISFQRSVFIPDRENGAITFVDGNGSFEARNLAMMIQESLVYCGFKDRGV